MAVRSCTYRDALHTILQIWKDFPQSIFHYDHIPYAPTHLTRQAEPEPYSVLRKTLPSHGDILRLSSQREHRKEAHNWIHYQSEVLQADNSSVFCMPEKLHLTLPSGSAAPDPSQ